MQMDIPTMVAFGTIAYCDGITTFSLEKLHSTLENINCEQRILEKIHMLSAELRKCNTKYCIA